MTTLVAVIAFMGASAIPANAIVTSAAAAPSGSTSSLGQDGNRDGDGMAGAGHRERGDFDVAMLMVTLGIGLAIAAPFRCRAHIARERSIRQFREDLRTADVVSLCQRLEW